MYTPVGRPHGLPVSLRFVTFCVTVYVCAWLRLARIRTIASAKSIARLSVATVMRLECLVIRHRQPAYAHHSRHTADASDSCVFLLVCTNFLLEQPGAPRWGVIGGRACRVHESVDWTCREGHQLRLLRDETRTVQSFGSERRPSA